MLQRNSKLATVRAEEVRVTASSRSCLPIADAAVGDDCGKGDSAEVGQGILVVAGGNGAPVFESVDASFNGVAVLVDPPGESWRAPPLLPLALGRAI